MNLRGPYCSAQRMLAVSACMQSYKSGRPAVGANSPDEDCDTFDLHTCMLGLIESKRERSTHGDLREMRRNAMLRARV